MSDQNKDATIDGNNEDTSSDVKPLLDKQELLNKFKSNLSDRSSEPEPKKGDEIDEPELDNQDEPEPKKGDEIDEPKPEDDDDLDLDADPDPNSEDDDEPKPEDDDKSIDKNIVALRKKHEELNNKYQAQEELLTKTQTELEETKEALEKYTLTNVDPKSHPDFKNLSDKTQNAIHSRLLRLKGVPNAADKLGEKWGNILTDVSQYETVPREEKNQALHDLRLSIAKELDLVDGDTQELDLSIDDEAIDAADKVIDVFENHTNDFNELAKIYSDIQSKAVDKSLSVGYEEYQRNTQPIRQSLALIDSMSEKDIEEDPTSLQALAAKKVASSAEVRAKSAKIDKLLIEMAFGAEALSQEELDRHSKSGKDMTEFQQAREKRVKEFRERRLPEIKALFVLLPQIKEMLPKYFDEQFKSEKKKAQKQAVREATSKKPKENTKKEVEALTKDQLLSNLRKNLS